MIQNEVFDHLYRKLTLRTDPKCDRRYNSQRMNRARLALSCQNYFLGTTFTNTTGAVGVTAIDQTEPLERYVILRGGGLNARSIGPVVAAPVDANIGKVDIQLYRSGSDKPQLNRIAMRSGHYVSDGQCQPWELDWPVPITLLPNEVIRAQFTQLTATAAATLYALNLYGVAVDPKFQCDADLLDDICAQVNDTEQRPLYLNLKSEDSGGAITFEAIGVDNREAVLTQEVMEHLLVLGFRRNANDYLPGNATMRISSSDAKAFSRTELVIKGFEFYTAPDNGYFRFAVPHLLRKGQSLNAQLTATTTTARNRLEGEINLLCVSV